MGAVGGAGSREKIIRKPWGHEAVLFEEGRARLKRLVVRRGERLSLQYHRDKAEFSVVTKGCVRVEFAQKGAGHDYDYRAGESFFVPDGVVHRITALQDAEIIELCAGSDKDIVRLEDQYGRVRQ